MLLLKPRNKQKLKSILVAAVEAKEFDQLQQVTLHEDLNLARYLP